MYMLPERIVFREGSRATVHNHISCEIPDREQLSMDCTNVSKNRWHPCGRISITVGGSIDFHHFTGHSRYILRRSLQLMQYTLITWERTDARACSALSPRGLMLSMCLGLRSFL